MVDVECFPAGTAIDCDVVIEIVIALEQLHSVIAAAQFGADIFDAASVDIDWLQLPGDIQHDAGIRWNLRIVAKDARESRELDRIRDRRFAFRIDREDPGEAASDETEQRVIGYS